MPQPPVIPDSGFGCQTFFMKSISYEEMYCDVTRKFLFDSSHKLSL